MNPALLLLLRMQTLAAVRRAFRGMRTVKGAAFVIVGVAMFIVWLAPIAFSVHVLPRTDPQTVRLFAPLMLVLLCVLTTFSGAGDRSISFTPGEVNFLFPGPFNRRELLLYKLARTLAGALLSGFIMSIVLLRHSSGWPAAFTGSILAMLFVQLFTLAIVMVAQTVGERAYTRGRKIVLGLLIAAVAVAVVPQVRQVTHAVELPTGEAMGRRDADGMKIGPPNPVEQFARALDRSPVARVVLSPVVPFVRTFTADSIGDGLLWGAASLGIVLALLFGVIRLDADYREVAMAASQRVYERRQRAREGKLMSQFRGKPGTRRRSRLRMFPYLGGAGPTAWRQLTAAMRTSRAMLWFFLLISLTIVPAFFTRGKGGSAAIILATASWGTMLLTSMLRFDFRGELDQMEWLKALPLGPVATAAGQLAVPVLVLSVMQVLLVSVGCYVTTPQERIYLLAALPFLLPFNLLMIGVENLMFLLFPAREAGAAPGDVGLVGRNIVFFILKILVVVVATGLAAVFGQIIYFLSGHSWIAAGAAAWVVMCCFAVALVPAVGLAYKRFDPSRDTPA